MNVPNAKKNTTITSKLYFYEVVLANKKNWNNAELACKSEKKERVAFSSQKLVHNTVYNGNKINNDIPNMFPPPLFWSLNQSVYPETVEYFAAFSSARQMEQCVNSEVQSLLLCFPVAVQPGCSSELIIFFMNRKYVNGKTCHIFIINRLFAGIKSRPLYRI